MLEEDTPGKESSKGKWEKKLEHAWIVCFLFSFCVLMGEHLGGGYLVGRSRRADREGVCEDGEEKDSR